MPQDTRIALFLMGELIYALRTNDPDAFRQWLSGGVQDLGHSAGSARVLERVDPFITGVEGDRTLAWQLGGSL